MKLIASVYLDQDVSVLIAEILRSRGLDALTTRDAHNLGADDEQQIAFAVREERLIVTHNRDDFQRLAVEYHEQERTHYGVVIARRRPVHEVARRLLALLDRLTSDELMNQLLYV